MGILLPVEHQFHRSARAQRYPKVFMPEGSYQYCDVSLPVPLDQPFTYSLPDTLRHRVRPGSRLLVPFGSRKLIGVILRCHDDRPDVAIRHPLRAPAEKLRVEIAKSDSDLKLNKSERELRAFLELYPGSHNLKDLEDAVRNASIAARALARKGIVTLKPEPVSVNSGPIRVRH